MKNSFKFPTIAAAILLFTSTAYAQGVGASATATATATIITPISITKNVDMDFGNVAVDAATPGTVILTPAGVRSVTGGVTLPATAGTVTAASFTVNGTADYTYTVILPATVTLTELVGATATMTATGFTSTPTTTGGAGLLSSLGAQTLNVGATLNVAAAQAAGKYVSGTAFSVIVNYN